MQADWLARLCAFFGLESLNSLDIRLKWFLHGKILLGSIQKIIDSIGNGISA